MRTKVKLTFKANPEKPEYFNTIKDIFDKYSPERMGCVLGTVWNNIRGGIYENNVIIVEKLPVVEAVNDNGNIVVI